MDAASLFAELKRRRVFRVLVGPRQVPPRCFVARLRAARDAGVPCHSDAVHVPRLDRYPIFRRENRWRRRESERRRPDTSPPIHSKLETAVSTISTARCATR